MNNLGYDKNLFILAFDHRSSLLRMLWGIEGRDPTEEEIQKAIDVKSIIYDGFRDAVQNKIPKENAAILVDEQLGSTVLHNAYENGFITILPVEKSGQDIFDFEYGDKFAEHIKEYHPTFVKVLVKYNPEGNKESNQKQLSRLKILSDFCHDNNNKFLIEPLVLPTPSQLQAVHDDKLQYDKTIRPDLMVKMVQEFQEKGIEADIWKIEGMESTEDYKKVVAQMKINGRDSVNAVVLGRGESLLHLESWLRNGAPVEGIVGFAIGRTIFLNSLMAYVLKHISRNEAVKRISENYQHFYEVFVKAKQNTLV